MDNTRIRVRFCPQNADCGLFSRSANRDSVGTGLTLMFFVQKDESAQDIRSIFANTEAAKFRKTKRDKRDHRHRIGSGRQGSGLIRMKSDIPVNRIFWRRG